MLPSFRIKEWKRKLKWQKFFFLLCLLSSPPACKSNLEDFIASQTIWTIEIMFLFPLLPFFPLIQKSVSLLLYFSIIESVHSQKLFLKVTDERFEFETVSSQPFCFHAVFFSKSARAQENFWREDATWRRWRYDRDSNFIDLALQCVAPASVEKRQPFSL